ncbi:MAG: hypothetical protein WC865_12925 [Bacteroidales bacterium]
MRMAGLLIFLFPGGRRIRVNITRDLPVEGRDVEAGASLVVRVIEDGKITAANKWPADRRTIDSMELGSFNEKTNNGSS